MRNFVAHFPRDKPWSLLFHAHGYGLSSMMPIRVAIAMGKLVQENYSQTLQTIYIVQGSWFMNFLCRCIFPFLTKQTRDKFILIEGSLLEVVSRLREEGLSLSDLKQIRDNFGKIEG
jgi:hypothetical protein